MFEEELFNFYKEFTKRFKFYNEKELLKKLKSVKIGFDNDLEYGGGGYYDYDTNKIKIAENTHEAIYHELLHHISKNKTKGNYSVGFDKNYRGKWIGMGLNEGYTEYLDQMIFDKYLSYNCYLHEQMIVKLLEDVTGKIRMLLCYLYGRLDILIKFLSKYLPINEVKDLVKTLDKYNDYLAKYEYSEENEEDYEDIKSILFNIEVKLSIYLKKIYKSYIIKSNKVISKTNYDKQIKEVIDFLNFTFEVCHINITEKDNLYFNKIDKLEHTKKLTDK